MVLAMTDEEEKFENAEMEEFAENEDQEKELARGNVMIKEKNVESDNLPKEKQESGDLKGEAVKDEKEKNSGFESPKGVEENDHDLKKKEERKDVLEIKNEVEGELVKEEIVKGVIKEGETNKTESKKDDESKKVDKEKDEPKKIANEKDEPEKIDKENDEPKKIENDKNEPKSIDKEKDEPKKIDKEKDEPKKIGDENDESKKIVKEKDEPKKIDESKKIDKEKDGSNKEGEKNVRSNEENREAKKEDEKNNGVDQETSQSKKVDEEKNKRDQENNASKKEDEMKESDDKENEGSKKEEERDDVISCNVDVNNISFKEQANQFSELKESEKMALVEMKTTLEEAIKGNRLFKDILQRKGSSKPKEKLEGIVQEAIKRQQEEGKKAEEGEKDQKDKQEQEEKEKEKENKEKAPTEEKKDEVIEESEGPNLDVTLWGIPLLPSKGDKQTDVLLLKFLRARDYKAGEAFEMLRNTLQWRKQNNIDSILNEDFANDFSSAAYMSGKDNEGHPVCYNIFGALDNIEMYNKTLSSEEKQERFLRWRMQLMEKGIQNLDFSPTGVSSLMQISDLKNTPGPSKKEVRLSAKQGVSLLLDNYPEFVAKHVSIHFFIHNCYKER